MQQLGSTVFGFNEVTSTNDVARNLLLSGAAAHGAVMVAAHQTRGRGQEQTEWQSDSGCNLLCSFIVEPAFLPVTHQVYLNFAICVALQECLSQLVAAEVQIKWPNDVYINRKKVTGVLIENSVQNQQLKYCIVGIGINVNQTLFDVPTATSLKLQDGVERNVNDVLKTLSRALNKWYEVLQRGDYTFLQQTYHKHLMGMNKRMGFQKNGQTFMAKVCGVDEHGRLILEADGQIWYFHNKEVEWKI